MSLQFIACIKIPQIRPNNNIETFISCNYNCVIPYQYNFTCSPSFFWLLSFLMRAQSSLFSVTRLALPRRRLLPPIPLDAFLPFFCTASSSCTPSFHATSFSSCISFHRTIETLWVKGCDVAKFAFITNTVYDIHFITTLENSY